MGVLNEQELSPGDFPAARKFGDYTIWQRERESRLLISSYSLPAFISLAGCISEHKDTFKSITATVEWRLTDHLCLDRL